jgi:hypothetical protein
VSKIKAKDHKAVFCKIMKMEWPSFDISKGNQQFLPTNLTFDALKSQLLSHRSSVYDTL